MDQVLRDREQDDIDQRDEGLPDEGRARRRQRLPDDGGEADSRGHRQLLLPLDGEAARGGPDGAQGAADDCGHERGDEQADEEGEDVDAAAVGEPGQGLGRAPAERGGSVGLEPGRDDDAACFCFRFL